MAKTKKKTEIEQEPIQSTASEKAGEVYDSLGKFIGRYIYLDKSEDVSILKSLCDSWLKTYSENNEFSLTIDLETNGLKFRDNDILLVAICWDGHNSVVFSPWTFEHEFFKEVLNTIPIDNTNTKFDVKFLNYKYKVKCNIKFCAMTAAQMGYPGIFPRNSFSLDNLVVHLLPGLKISKAVRSEFIDMPAGGTFTNDQIMYAACDVLTTYRLQYPLMKRLFNQDLLDMWKNVEVPILNLLVESEMAGVKVNVPLLQSMYTEKQEELNDMLADIQKDVNNLDHPKKPKLVKGYFNPKSPAQVIDMLACMGIRLSSTDAAGLSNALAETHNPFIKKIMDYRKIYDLTTKQMKGWINEDVDPSDNTIHTTYFSYGTITGRKSSRDPNLQQVTADLRKMMIARPGRKIVQADFSAYEMRACAALTGEPYLLQAFQDRAKMLPLMKELGKELGVSDPDTLVKKVNKKLIQVGSEELKLINNFAETDVHRRNGALIFGKDIPDITDTDRSIAKCVSLDTYLHTSNGIVKLGDLLPKKPKPDTYYDLKDVKVLTDEGYRDAPQIYYNGPGNGYKIKTATGRELICSDRHQFRSLNKKGEYCWIQSSKLKAGNELFVKNTETYSESATNNAVLFRFMGILSQNTTLQNEDTELICRSGLEDLEEYYNDYLLAKESKLKSKITGIRDPQLIIKDPDLIKSYKNFDIWTAFKNCSQLDVVEFLHGYFTKHHNYGWCIINEDRKLLRLFQNLTTRFDLCGRIQDQTSCGNPALLFWGGDQEILSNLFEGLLFSTHKQDSIREWRMYAPDRLQAIMYDAIMDGKAIGCTPEEFCKKVLEEKDFELLKFLVTNRLRKDYVVSINPVNNVLLADVSVPSNNTVVYEGLVSHNTLGYAVLYGAGPPRIQVSLAKEGFYYTLIEADKFLQKFFERLTKVQQFILETHNDVKTKGVVSTYLGRKLFLDPGPKWKRNEYQKQLAACCREATNFRFQANNADATKISEINIYNTFNEMYEEDVRPILLLNVHDELVYDVPDELIEEAAPIITNTMVEAGMLATGGNCPIETSLLCEYRYWSK